MKAVAIASLLMLAAAGCAVQSADASLFHWAHPFGVRPVFHQWRDPFQHFNKMWNQMIAQQQQIWSCQNHCANVAARALSESMTVTEAEANGGTVLTHTFPGVRASDVSVSVNADRLIVRASRPVTASPTAARDAECGCPVDGATTVTTTNAHGCTVSTQTRSGAGAAKDSAPATEQVERVYQLPRFTATDQIVAALTENSVADQATGAPPTEIASVLVITIPKPAQPQVKAVPIAVTKSVTAPVPKPAIAPAAQATPTTPAAPAPAAAPAAPAPAPAALLPVPPKPVESDVIDLDKK